MTGTMPGPDDQPASAIIHVIDDDKGLGEALVRLFRSVGHQARAYGSVAGFLDAERGPGPACLVLDVRLPDASGLDFQASLQRRGIALPVVMITGYGDIPMSVRAMKNGAVDFLIKPFREQELLDAVGRALERDREQRSADDARSQVAERYAHLTPRERQVLDCVVEGLMNKEIAERLALSIVTVKAHRGALSRKMGVRNLADLVRQAQAIGIE